MAAKDVQIAQRDTQLQEKDTQLAQVHEVSLIKMKGLFRKAVRLLSLFYILSS